MRLNLNGWISDLARSSFAVNAGCTFTLGRFDRPEFAKHAPSSPSIAPYALVGQAKNRSPTHPL
jgi:hypothetical protein